MKIYNFAVEVYDSPGSRIGCRRSCGQHERELISHEVISQLLFSTAHPLNSCNTTFFLASRINKTRVECCCWSCCWTCFCIFYKKKREKSGWCSLCATPRRVRHVYVPVLVWLFFSFVKMRDHHTRGWTDYFHDITYTKWGFLLGVGGWEEDWQEARGARAEWHPRWKWWIINKGKGTMFLIRLRLTQQQSAPLLQLNCGPGVYITGKGRSVFQKWHLSSSHRLFFRFNPWCAAGL